MASLRIPFLTTMLIAGILCLAGSAIASPDIQVSMGDDIPLSGYAPSGPYVYLFLTGPNLPVNGVALHDISRRADQGGFTRVSVDGDDHWSYTWHTGSIGGRLDEGTYTIWVVSGPNDRSRLAWADYRTLSVTLGKPYVRIDTPAQPGGMNLQSVPEGASLMVNGEYRGKTPLRISGLSPGNYAVTFSRFGFREISIQVPVNQGTIAEVNATLLSETGTLSVNSTPPGARVMLDGNEAGLSPVVLKNISADNHTISLEKNGYAPAVRQVRIEAGQVSPVDVPLDPVPVPPTTTRAAGLIPALSGAFFIILLGAAYRHRRNR